MRRKIVATVSLYAEPDLPEEEVRERLAKLEGNVYFQRIVGACGFSYDAQVKQVRGSDRP